MGKEAQLYLTPALVQVTCLCQRVFADHLLLRNPGAWSSGAGATTRRHRLLTILIKQEHVDNPHTSYAQYLHDLSNGKSSPGKIMAEVNQVAKYGGFALFNGTESQNKAAETFKSLAEASEIGRVGAIDTAKEPVDGGWINPEMIFLKGDGARRAINQIYSHLGKADFERFWFVVVREKGPTPYCVWRHKRKDGRLVAKCKGEIRQIANKLASHLQLSSA